MVKKKKSDYEGLQTNVRKMKTPDIGVWENQYAGRDYKIELDIPEFTCICPKTGLPDFATVKVAYTPQKFCLELKSFKMYIVSFRDAGIFHEHFVNRILDDVVKACGPKWARVEATVNPRGGITTTVTAEYKGRSS
ncbi:MAG: NADPH-dependent 7-cyano-7-deazaguanine reductase QueF [Candidatus Omnitrophica bacterium]|nr:NADPH-dependent 7-cyano-7-deazaguanine reductase QueF [Candidatus Omnitrophota bacterium]